jgi:hypothetical protein
MLNKALELPPRIQKYKVEARTQSRYDDILGETAMTPHGTVEGVGRLLLNGLVNKQREREILVTMSRCSGCYSLRPCALAQVLTVTRADG